MSRRLIAPALAGLGLTLALGACAAPLVGNPCPVPDNATVAERQAAINICNAPIGTLPLPFQLHKDVDILFLIDNSPSMSPKQKALAQNIPLFIKEIEKTGANYHVGIATSDVGADVALGQLWGGNIGTCDTFAGDDGVLQAKPCTQRTFSTPDGANACATLCPDPRFVPSNGTNYISKVNGVTNVPAALVLDGGKMVDQGPSNAFRCMALVADQGCGVESQLEGSLRALDGHRPDNAGFLRSNSILAIIYITDEDDCSVQLAMRNQLNPKTRACDPNQPDDYDCYNIDYRCLARSVQCDQSMLTPGAKTNCKERPNNFLEPLQKYVSFFTKLRPANKLLVSGIWTLPSIPGGGKVNVVQDGTMPPTTATLNRAPRTDASCSYSADAGVFGQAQFRLSQFTSMLPLDTGSSTPTPTALEVSICDIDQYPTALQNIAKAINQKGEAACLTVVPKTSNGKPVCLVGDVDANTPNGAPDVAFPVCSTSCCGAFASSTAPTPADPAIQTACAAETTAACYCAVKSTVGQCTGEGQVGIVAGIWRKDGAAAPEGKQANFLCAGGG